MTTVPAPAEPAREARPCCPAGGRRYALELLDAVDAYEAWRAAAPEHVFTDGAPS